MVLRTGKELAGRRRRQPVPGGRSRPRWWSPSSPTASRRRRCDDIDPSAFAPDEFTFTGRELYVKLPNGQARSKLMEALNKRDLGTTATTRNWRTVVALADMTA